MTHTRPTLEMPDIVLNRSNNYAVRERLLRESSRRLGPAHSKGSKDSDTRGISYSSTSVVRSRLTSADNGSAPGHHEHGNRSFISATEHGGLPPLGPSIRRSTIRHWEIENKSDDELESEDEASIDGFDEERPPHLVEPTTNNFGSSVLHAHNHKSSFSRRGQKSEVSNTSMSGGVNVKSGLKRYIPPRRERKNFLENVDFDLLNLLDQETVNMEQNEDVATEMLASSTIGRGSSLGGELSKILEAPENMEISAGCVDEDAGEIRLVRSKMSQRVPKDLVTLAAEEIKDISERGIEIDADLQEDLDEKLTRTKEVEELYDEIMKTETQKHLEYSEGEFYHFEVMVELQ